MYICIQVIVIARLSMGEGKKSQDRRKAYRNGFLDEAVVRWKDQRDSLDLAEIGCLGVRVIVPVGTFCKS